MRECLVVNKNFCAVSVTTWKNAMSLLYQGVADAIDDDYMMYSFEDWKELSKLMKKFPNGFVRTVKDQIAVPEIIRLRNFEKLPKRAVKFTRRNIYKHYNYRCCYCGNTFHTSKLNLDHVIPKSRGGKTNWENIVTSCLPCNTKKRNRTPEEAGMRLLTHPTRPKWKGNKSVLEINSNIEIKLSWQKIIDAAYWDQELKKDRNKRKVNP